MNSLNTIIIRQHRLIVVKIFQKKSLITLKIIVSSIVNEFIKLLLLFSRSMRINKEQPIL